MIGRRAALVVAATGVLLVAAATTAMAQEEHALGGKFRSGDQIRVDAGETVDGDVYAFAGTIVVDGDVTGDLVVFGGTIVVGGEVGGDLLAAGGTVDVTGAVAGDARLSGGNLGVSGTVGEDLLAAGGRLGVGGGVGGDLVFGAGQVDLSGTVDGDVLGRTGSYDRTGAVGGAEDVTIAQPRDPGRERGIVGAAVGLYSSILLVGLVALLVGGGRRVGTTIGMLRDEPGPAVLWGLAFLLALVVIPVGVLVPGILLGLVLGWLGLGQLVGLVGLAVVAVWTGLAFVAFLLIALLAPVTVGAWLAGLVLPETTPTFVAVALGAAVLVTLGLIPVAGPIVGGAVSVLGAGAWLRSFRRRTPRTAPVA